MDADRDHVETAVAGRREAAVVAGHVGDEVTARTLLDDPSPSVRASALAARSRLGAMTAHDLHLALGALKLLALLAVVGTLVALALGATAVLLSLAVRAAVGS